MFFDMWGSYESRKVDRFEDDNGLMVSTVEVTDVEEFNYETAVKHPLYNDGELIIVEQYTTIGEAQKGHDEWVKKMTKKKLPDELKDISTSEWALGAKAVSNSDEWTFKKTGG